MINVASQPYKNLTTQFEGQRLDQDGTLFWSEYFNFTQAMLDLKIEVQYKEMEKFQFQQVSLIPFVFELQQAQRERKICIHLNKNIR